jgi:hypothetical protein
MHEHQLCGSCGASKMCVLLCLVAKMSHQILEQWINIASDTCAVLSEGYGGDAMKKSSVFK